MYLIYLSIFKKNKIIIVVLSIPDTESQFWPVSNMYQEFCFIVMGVTWSFLVPAMKVVV